jgi:hypothetical protein
MKKFNLRNLIKPNKTLLGVDLMSINCVDAAEVSFVIKNVKIYFLNKASF